MTDSSMWDDLDTPLSASGAAGLYARAEAAAAAPPRASAKFKERCANCAGTGSWRGRGKCFACNGRGFKEFATSPQQRARSRERAEDARFAKADRAAALAEGWKAEHPLLWTWILSRRERFDFAREMGEALERYGDLTPAQQAAVERLAARDAERDTARTAEREAIKAAAPAVTVDKIVEAFQIALGRQVRAPKLRLDSFVFARAPDHGRNAGAIYVRQGDDYLGKIVRGKFERTFSCDAPTEARIVAAANDPEAAAVAYGQRFGACSICGRTLTVGESIDRGIGPVCAANFGW